MWYKSGCEWRDSKDIPVNNEPKQILVMHEFLFVESYLPMHYSYLYTFDSFKSISRHYFITNYRWKCKTGGSNIIPSSPRSHHRSGSTVHETLGFTKIHFTYSTCRLSHLHYNQQLIWFHSSTFVPHLFLPCGDGNLMLIEWIWKSNLDIILVSYEYECIILASC